MELRVLRYFVTVAREENITRAAEVLHVSQPALSRQLASLEDELGTTLFYRGNRRITLTEAGMLLRRRAEEVLTLIGRTEEEIRDSGGPVEGTVCIGTAEAAATRVLPDLIGDFRARYPQVRYELFTANAESVKNRIDRGLLDIGLVTEPVDVSRYECAPLPEKDRWGILTSVESPLAEKDVIRREDLRGEPLIVPRRPEVQQVLKEWFGRQNIQIIAVYNVLGTGAGLVEEGLCHALTLEIAGTWYKKACFRPLEPVLLCSSVLIWKKYQPTSEAVRRFIEAIRARLLTE